METETKTDKIRLGATILCDFLVANDRTRRSVLSRAKYDEGFRRPYYRDASHAIRKLHADSAPTSLLLSESTRLEVLSHRNSSERDAARMRDNARVLESYAEHVGDRRWQLVASPRGAISHGGVVVTGQFDLVGLDGRKLCAMRLQMSDRNIDELWADHMCRVLFACTQGKVDGLRLRNVSVLDVRQGIQHYATGSSNARFMSIVLAAMETIADIWPSLARPKQRKKVPV